MRRPEFDGSFEVAAHAHAEEGQSRLMGELLQQCEMRGRRLIQRWDAHQAAHRQIQTELGAALAQYVVPLAFRVRWYFRVNLREIYHLCELRTTPQGHPDYRWVAQEMFRQVSQVHPRLARYATFVDMGPGDELERRQAERRLDEKLRTLDRRVL